MNDAIQHFSGSRGWHLICTTLSAMTEILLCSNNPILARSLHAILREEGYRVDIAEHPALAVQMVFIKRYAAAIMDPEPFGLSVEDAIRIIRTVQPEMLVIFSGQDKLEEDVLSIEAPIDLEVFKRTIQGIRAPEKTLRSVKAWSA
jgi:CheY-like chemotaxis protein